MRFLNCTAASYVGVDLHARTLFVCALDQAGQIKLSRNLPARPEQFLAAVEPFVPALLRGWSRAAPVRPRLTWPGARSARA